MANIPSFEPGDTPQFTWVSSLAPDAAPTLKIYGTAGTVVASIAGISSTTTSYYAMYTMPTSAGLYEAQWFALRTIGTSAYQFVKTMVFEVRSLVAA